MIVYNRFKSLQVIKQIDILIYTSQELQIQYTMCNHSLYRNDTVLKWTLFIIRLRLLFYFVFRTRSICFRNIYRLQMALGCRHF